MKASFAVLLLALLPACAGPAAQSSPETTIVVPPQPPQPVAAAPADKANTPSASGAGSPAPVAAPPFRCDGKRFDVAGRAYCGYTEPDTWEGSERRCAAAGGHLMTLESEAASEALHAALGSPLGAGRAAWIGLELKVKGRPGVGEWKWSSGDPVRVASWSTGEPNNFDRNEGCGEWLVVDGRWNDTRCEMRQPYLCEARPGKELRCKGGRSFAAGATSYCLNATERSFADAKRACLADGGQLAEPKTNDDNRAVREAMASRFTAARMWIGLTDAAEEGNWSWTSGAPLAFEAWKPGEPNDYDDEDCAQLFGDSWRWNDFDCSARLPSVCESAKR